MWHEFCRSYTKIMDEIIQELQFENISATQYSNEALVFLNTKDGCIDPRIYHKNDPCQDKLFYEALNHGDWSFFDLSHEQILESAFSLYLSGKLNFHQKFTVSDIIGSSKIYGKFIAHPVLDEDGNFSSKALELFVPCLREDFQDNLIELIKQMPKAERFFFEYFEQKLDDNGSAPSKHSLLRENLATQFMFDVYPIELLKMDWDKDDDFQKYFSSPYLTDIFYSHNRANNAKMIANITSLTHPLKLKYNGILKFSASITDAIGLIRDGVKNWGKLIPRIGVQTVEDIELFSKFNARPAPAPDAFRFGIFKEHEEVHLRLEAYPELLAHDEYHRRVLSELGRDFCHIIDAMIELARVTFGFRWSKDIWILRDLNLLREPRFYIESFKKEIFTSEEFLKCDGKISSAIFREKISKSSNALQQKYMTGLLAAALATTYAPEELDPCQDEDKKIMLERNILTTKENKISQFGMCFIIDLVLNRDKWLSLKVSDDPLNWQQPFSPCYYAKLIEFVKVLNTRKFFKDSMKANVIMFSNLLDHNKMTLDTNYGEAWSNLGALKQNKQLDMMSEISIDDYLPGRDNKNLFLGFR